MGPREPQTACWALKAARRFAQRDRGLCGLGCAKRNVARERTVRNSQTSRSIVSDGLQGEAAPRHRSRRRLRKRSGRASVRPGRALGTSKRPERVGARFKVWSPPSERNQDRAVRPEAYCVSVRAEGSPIETEQGLQRDSDNCQQPISRGTGIQTGGIGVE